MGLEGCIDLSTPKEGCVDKSCAIERPPLLVLFYCLDFRRYVARFHGASADRSLRLPAHRSHNYNNDNNT
eukprot:scaffold233456_cov28-Tisochrysis_lutea.AAC.5